MKHVSSMFSAACAAIAVLSTAYAIGVFVCLVRLVRNVPILERLSPPEPAKWPKVSVIVAACNEEGSLEAAMRSRLGEGYPNAEYIVVDDRSTDRTAAIVDRLATEDPRVEALHVTELPDGWLGKVHAMDVGLSRATGEWILFSDADIHHEPGALSRVISYCEEEAIDHMAVFPTVYPGSFALNVVMNAFIRMFAIASRGWSVSDPRSKASVGGGNFNLVRRAALDRIGGIAPLKMEVVDDAALGQLLKFSGARAGILNARGFVGLAYYSSVIEAVRGMEKNAFAVIGRFSVARFVAIVGLLLVLEPGGFVVAGLGSGWPCVLAGAGAVLAILNHVIASAWIRRPLLPSLFGPFGLVVMYAAAVRSMILTLVRGGIEWRGTKYSLATLRRGMRYLHVA